jgi:membrane AbrB-like protein
MTVPLLAKYYALKKPREVSGAVMKTKNRTDGKAEKKEYSLALTLTIGFISGFLVWKTGVPNGAMLGSMAFVGAARIYNGKIKGLPKTYVSIALVVLGASLGLRLTPEAARALLDLVGVAVLFSVITFLNGYFLAILMNRVFKIDMITAVLACAAAGVTQMSAIAIDMDADVVSVSVLHSLRLIIIVAVLPVYILYVA